MDRPSIIERSLELARSGKCRRVEDIRRRLKEEGFSQVDEHLAGRSFKRQLLEVCAEASRLNA